MILAAALLLMQADSLAVLLERALPESASYLLLDARSRQVLAARWPDADRPFSAGSLAKPAIALAYGRRHEFRYPVFECRGRCWSPRPHGRLDLPHALSVSCNNYFNRLMEGSTPERFTPVDLARWYSDLAERAPEPGVAPILRGLVLAAEEGTARALGPGVLAKTGTARCIHQPRGAGDGYVMAMLPAERPAFTLLVRLHDEPGSHAAAACSRVLVQWGAAK